jgi:hypothetical protein
MKRCLAVAAGIVLLAVVLLGTSQSAQAGWGVHVAIRGGGCYGPVYRGYYYPHYYYGPSFVYVGAPPVYYAPAPVYVVDQPAPAVVYTTSAVTAAPVAVQAPAPAGPAVPAAAPSQPPPGAPGPAAPPDAAEAAAQAAAVAASPQPAAPQPAPPQAVAAARPPVVLIDAKAAEYLRTLVQGDDSAREKAAKELKKFNVSPVISALIDAVQRDGYSDAREQAAISLGEMLARDAQPTLRRAAREDPDKDVRKAALKAAQKIETAYGIQP